MKITLNFYLNYYWCSFAFKCFKTEFIMNIISASECIFIKILWNMFTCLHDIQTVIIYTIHNDEETVDRRHPV